MLLKTMFVASAPRYKCALTQGHGADGWAWGKTIVIAWLHEACAEGKFSGVSPEGHRA